MQQVAPSNSAQVERNSAARRQLVDAHFLLRRSDALPCYAQAALDLRAFGGKSTEDAGADLTNLSPDMNSLQIPRARYIIIYMHTLKSAGLNLQCAFSFQFVLTVSPVISG